MLTIANNIRHRVYLRTQNVDNFKHLFFLDKLTARLETKSLQSRGYSFITLKTTLMHSAKKGIYVYKIFNYFAILYLSNFLFWVWDFSLEIVLDDVSF